MFADLRGFIAKATELGQCKLIEGADWNLEIGLITEWQAGLANSPMILFDRITDYKSGYRVASNLFSTMHDDEFLSDVRGHNIDVDPLTGEQVCALVRKVYSSSPKAIARVKTAIEDGTKESRNR